MLLHSREVDKIWNLCNIAQVSYMSQYMRFPTMWYLRPAKPQSLCKSLEYSMIVKLLTEHHLEFLSLKGGCTGSTESILVKIPHCWKSHVTVHFLLNTELFAWFTESNQDSSIFQPEELFWKSLTGWSGPLLAHIHIPLCLKISCCGS